MSVSGARHTVRKAAVRKAQSGMAKLAVQLAKAGRS
jgi:hypothetical protein